MRHSARRFSAYTAGAVAGIAVGVIAGTSAFGSSVSTQEDPLVVPQDQVQVSWTLAVESSDLTLPDGVSFPAEAPSFFTPSDPEAKHVYERGLFSTFVTQFWHCSWLEASVNPQRATSQSARVESELAHFVEELPAVSATEYTEYRHQLSLYATEVGLSAEELELNNDCKGLTR